jgi:ATP-dependent RNA helicase HelY
VREFHLLAEVLRRRDLLSPSSNAVTARGRRLAGIYSPVDLLVAEALEAGSFDGLQPHELAGLAALLVYEARRDDVLAPEELPTAGLTRVAAELSALLEELRSVERDVGVTPMRDLDPGFVEPAVRWARGASLEDAVGELEISGGDFVRNVKQTLDLLGQLRDVTEGPLHLALAGAVSAVQRGIVDA